MATNQVTTTHVVQALKDVNGVEYAAEAIADSWQELEQTVAYLNANEYPNDFEYHGLTGEVVTIFDVLRFTHDNTTTDKKEVTP
jgi:hypothetical protein